MSKYFIPDLYGEYLIRSVYGPQWRQLSQEDIDGAFGIAIIKSIIDGKTETSLRDVSNFLGVRENVIEMAHYRLFMNGIFLHDSDRIMKDHGLIGSDIVPWCYYAGIASGATGNVIC